MKKITSLLLCLWICLPSLAQFQLQGTAVETLHQPAPYTTIRLASATDSSTIKGAVTDEKGFFRIDNLAAGTYLLHVQSVGHQATWLPVFSLNETNPTKDFGVITLNEKTEKLAEITVKGQRSLVENQGDRMVLTVANSVIAKGNKVEDLLNYAPLVSKTPLGIKVGNKSNVLMLVDGRQMGQGALDNFLQNFSAEDILKIDVIPNPSAKYDASFGAVINIITKKSLERGINGRLSTTYSQGHNGRFNPNGSLNLRSPKWNVFTTLNGRLDQVGSEEATERAYQGGSMSGQAFSAYKTKGFSTFSGVEFFPNLNHALGIRFNSNAQTVRSTTDGTTAFRSHFVGEDSLLLLSRLETDYTRNYDANINYTGKLDSTGKELSVNLTKSFFDRSNTQYLGYQYQNADGSSIRPPSRARIQNPKTEENLILKADLTLPTKGGRWESGFQLTAISNDNLVTQENEASSGVYVLDSNFSNSGKYSENSFAGYASYSTKFRPGWSVQTGLRYERTHQELVSSNLSRIYSGFFPSLSLSKTLHNGPKFSFSYARKIARPSLSALVPYRWQSDPYLISVGNPGLKPSFAHTLDANVTLGGLTLSINYSNTQDAILNTVFFDPDTRIYTVSFTNLARLHSEFVGLTWGHDWYKWWSMNWNLGLRGSQTDSPIGQYDAGKLTGYGLQTYINNVFSLPKSYKAELLLVYESPNRSTINQSKALFFTFISLNKSLFTDGNIKLIFRDVFHSQLYRYVVSYGNVSSSNQYYNDNQRIQVAFTYNFGKRTVKPAKDRSLGNDAEKNRMGGGVR
ncbi:TonB-dependent receptor [Spirosoma sp. KCTC 42546]|uniref:TonB-dependent receptor domain-containing protein n=1 Tax=Spirosoma sp. KCTC 42546 TaxID=2520506 RepID=UPI00115B97C3|nr:TonB-dependent receptor [Spirosoma sp. KCTC 42546]QDK82544.1 TonB-dependent receptor [Spirosoma sp. KCTC 42546]